MFKQPILITGCPRSGASMVARVINLCGAWTGWIDNGNRKWMNENKALRNEFTNLITQAGRDGGLRMDLTGVEEWMVKDWCQDVEKILKKQGLSPNRPWLFKDSRMMVAWNVWHNCFPEAIWVIVRRTEQNIVDSCLKTGWINTFKLPENRTKVQQPDEKSAWEWMVSQYLEKYELFKKSGARYFEIWPERLCAGDYSELISLIEKIGLKYNPQAIYFMDSKLKGGQKWQEQLQKM